MSKYQDYHRYFAFGCGERLNANAVAVGKLFDTVDDFIIIVATVVDILRCYPHIKKQRNPSQKNSDSPNERGFLYYYL